MSEMRDGGSVAGAARERGRTSAAVVGLSLLLVVVGFLAGVFATRAFGQPAGAAVVRPRPGTVPRAGLGPGGVLRPGGRLPGGERPGSNLPMLPSNGSIAFGTITGVKGNTLILKTASGQTLTVQVGDSTAIRVVKSGSVGDLTTGSTILVIGTRSNDGTLQARAINEGGAVPGGFAGPGGSSSTAGGTGSGGFTG